MTIYRMFDWGDYADGHGAYAFDRWQRLNPAQGEYNWSIIDSWLDKNAGKPTLFAVATSLSSLAGWQSFADCTPEWVYANDAKRPVMHGRRVGKVVTWTDDNADPPVTYEAALPYYNDTSVWWPALKEFTLAFGARYNGDPRLTAVGLACGLDIENQVSKSPFPDGNQGYRFGQLVTNYSDWYAEAFPGTRCFAVCTIGQGRMKLAQHAAANGQGVKHNGGFIQDMDSHQGYDNFVGSWDYMQWANENNVPTWVESAYGYLSTENRYWAIWASLAYHPVAVDIHSGLLDKFTPEQVQLISAFTNVTAETSPAAWCVLRDMEYPLVKWTGGNDGLPYGCSGHPGDWNFYLRRTSPDSGAKRVEDVGPEDAPESRQCRLVTDATFHVDLAAEPPYELSVRWLQEQDKTLWVDDGNSLWMVESDGSGTWKTTPVTIKSRTFTLRGGVHVHMVYAAPIEVEPQPPDPPEPPGPTLDSTVLWAGINGAQAAIDDARREVYRADVTIGWASESIAEAARALQAAVAHHEEASKAAVAAMETLDLATAHLADMRAELERVS